MQEVIQINYMQSIMEWKPNLPRLAAPIHVNA